MNETTKAGSQKLVVLFWIFCARYNWKSDNHRTRKRSIDRRLIALNHMTGILTNLSFILNTLVFWIYSWLWWTVNVRRFFFQQLFDDVFLVLIFLCCFVFAASACRKMRAFEISFTVLGPKWAKHVSIDTCIIVVDQHRSLCPTTWM